VQVGRIFTLGDFGESLLAIKQGLKVRRAEWQHGTYVAAQIPDAGSVNNGNYAYQVTAEGVRVPWLPNQLDLFARDWQTVA
jgi:hypothetical protein